MTHLQTKLALCAAVGTFAACTAAPEPDPTLYFGSTDPAASRSGLDFADGQNVSDLEGQAHTVRLVVQATNTTNGSVDEAITDETLTLTALADNDFSLTFEGETLNFGDGTALRGDGSTLQGQIIGLPGDTLFQAVRLQGAAGDEQVIGHLVTGFETSPDAARLTTGSVSYGGGVEGVMNTDTPTNFFGTFTLIADFGNGRIGGDMNLGNVNTDLGTTGVEFDLLPVDITGNGFVGELTLVNCSEFATCSTETELGGVFYGPNAEGLAGLLTLDITVTEGMDTAQNSGNGVFGGENE